jgi:F-type H+-transporting ATPase subunit beta
MNEGKVAQVIGAVVDVEFEKVLPKVKDAMTVDHPGDPSKGIPEIHITLEAAIHLGENKVRTIAMGPTDGLVRGMKVVDTGQHNSSRRKGIIRKNSQCRWGPC